MFNNITYDNRCQYSRKQKTMPYCTYMKEILKTCVGFAGILFIGLAGVFFSELLKLGDMNALIVTVDNMTRMR